MACLALAAIEAANKIPPLSMASILQTHDLHKSFGALVATDSVSLTVQTGEVHAIVGPNGAGKTTLLSLLSGSLKPDSGRIEFNGKDVTRTPAHKRVRLGLARSFQITSLILPMTVLENVMLAVQGTTGHSLKFWSPVSKEKDTQTQAMHFLQAVKLQDKSQHLADALSHGEQRQLEIAIALALKPKLLLLDEPMAGMSKEETRKMIDLLRDLKGDITILLVEHDMDAVFALADRTSVLVEGGLIATGTTEEIRSNTEVQQAYLGEA